MLSVMMSPVKPSVNSSMKPGLLFVSVLCVMLILPGSVIPSTSGSSGSHSELFLLDDSLSSGYVSTEDFLSDFFLNNESVRTEYYTYETMTALLHDIQDLRPDIVSLESLGRTYENREMWAVRVTGPGEPAGRPGALFVGAHHAREWISFEVPIAILETLVYGYEVDTRITWLVDNRDIWIVPMINPDGVAFMQETGTNWRKNRQPWRGDPIWGAPRPIGVDLNRNYGYMWGAPNIATTQNPFSDTYRGPEPFSERETRAIRDLAARESFVTAISYHSYSELVLYPWGHARIPPPDEEVFRLVGSTMADMTNYTLMQACDLYPASGDTTDYLYAEHGILAYTFELAKEFIPPPEEINEHNVPNIEAALFLAEVSDNPWQDNPVVGHDQVIYSATVGESFSVEAEITSHRDIRAARVYYSVDGGEYVYTTLSRADGDTYIGEISVTGGGEISYYVWAEDILGHSSTNMTYAPVEAYSFMVLPGSSSPIGLYIVGAVAMVAAAVILLRKLRQKGYRAWP